MKFVKLDLDSSQNEPKTPSSSSKPLFKLNLPVSTDVDNSSSNESTPIDNANNDVINEYSDSSNTDSSTNDSSTNTTTYDNTVKDNTVRNDSSDKNTDSAHVYSSIADSSVSDSNSSTTTNSSTITGVGSTITGISTIADNSTSYADDSTSYNSSISVDSSSSSAGNDFSSLESNAGENNSDTSKDNSDTVERVFLSDENSFESSSNNPESNFKNNSDNNFDTAEDKFESDFDTVRNDSNHIHSDSNSIENDSSIVQKDSSNDKNTPEDTLDRTENTPDNTSESVPFRPRFNFNNTHNNPYNSTHNNPQDDLNDSQDKLNGTQDDLNDDDTEAHSSNSRSYSNHPKSYSNLLKNSFGVTSDSGEESDSSEESEAFYDENDEPFTDDERPYSREEEEAFYNDVKNYQPDFYNSRENIDESFYTNNNSYANQDGDELYNSDDAYTDEGSDEAESFLGFDAEGNILTDNNTTTDSNTIKDNSTLDEDLLKDLLEYDDDDEYDKSKEKHNSTDNNSADHNPFFSDDEDDNISSSDDDSNLNNNNNTNTNSNLNSNPSIALESFKKFQQVAASAPELTPEEQLMRDNEKAEREAKVEEKRAENKKKKAAKARIPNPNKLESDFQNTNIREVVVNPDGTTSTKFKGSDAPRGTTKKQGDDKRYRNNRNNGRLNEAELRFFKNLETSKKGSKIEPAKLLRLKGKALGEETAAERKVRSILFEQAVSGREALKRGTHLRFTQKDREVLQFLAMFRYVTDQQLARMFSQRTDSMYRRLTKLKKQGLVINRRMYGARPIWFLTEAGMIMSGYDLPRITDAKLTYSMFPHQFTVNHVAANLWGANLNVLNSPEYPERNKIGPDGEKVFGEELVSELEIQSSLGKVRSFRKGEAFIPEMKAQTEKDFKDWKNAGGVEFGDSPEMIPGNEFMWALTPPYNLRLAYHVPDLVVKRPRNADGTPNSIAIEVEINNKPLNSYEKTLRAYKADKRIFKEVVWVCKNVGPAKKLEEIAKEIGLWQESRIRIVPILTEHGVFKNKDLWTI